VPPGSHAVWKLADERAAGGEDLLGQPGMRGWIDDGQSQIKPSWSAWISDTYAR
jgi:hypothetical protein